MPKQRSLLFIIIYFLVIGSRTSLSLKFLELIEPQLLLMHKSLKNAHYAELLSRFDVHGFLYHVAKGLEERSAEVFRFYTVKTMAEQEARDFVVKPTVEQMTKMLSHVKDFHVKGSIDKSIINGEGCGSIKRVGDLLPNNAVVSQISRLLPEFDTELDLEDFTTHIEKAVEDGSLADIEASSSSEGLHVENLLRRIHEDQSIIKLMLDVDEAESLYLTGIQLNKGDQHTHGGGVSILSFYVSEEKQSLKLVYKTGPLRPDYITIGATSFYKKLRKGLGGRAGKLMDYDIEQSFYEILRTPLAGNSESASPINPYRVVPIELSAEGEQLEIKDMYGYVEFIEGTMYTEVNLPELTETLSLDGDLRDHPYYQIGFLVESMRFLRGTDLHDDNLIVSKPANQEKQKVQVVPIDMESIFTPALLPESEDSILHLTERDRENPSESHLVNQNKTYGEVYKAGSEALHSLVNEKRKELAEWLSASAVRSTPIRFIPLDSSNLYMTLWCIPQIVPPTMRHQTLVMNANFVDKLARWEIPAFYMRAGGKSLLDADGRPVTFNIDEVVDALCWNPSQTAKEKSRCRLKLLMKAKSTNPLFVATPLEDTLKSIKENFGVDTAFNQTEKLVI